MPNPHPLSRVLSHEPHGGVQHQGGRSARNRSESLTLPAFDKFHVYCDESSTADRYTVIGALVCHETVEPKFTRWLDSIVEKGRPTSELKWQKVKRHNLALYKEVVAATLKACASQYACYYAIVVDNSAMNNRLYNEGDKEIGFNKMLFQLMFKLARVYRNQPRFYVHLDYRTTKHTPERLREMLNAKARKDLRVTHEPYRTCHFRQSHEVRLIQAADIITGAIGYRLNQHDLAVDAAAHKVELMKYVAELAGVRTLCRQTPFRHADKKGFDVWHIDLNARAKGVSRS